MRVILSRDALILDQGAPQSQRIEPCITLLMSNNVRGVKRNYEWDPERKLFIPYDTAVDEDEDGDENASSLMKCSLEQLALIPDWLIPLTRRDELHRYKACRQREARARLQDYMNSKIRSQPSGVLNRKPEVRYGPRGGRYTDDITRDGRPYRRYF
jgi:hypothetical protein